MLLIFLKIKSFKISETCIPICWMADNNDKSKTKVVYCSNEMNAVLMT